jgi:hypothetical protein
VGSDANLALAVGRSNHSARSHPQLPFTSILRFVVRPPRVTPPPHGTSPSVALSLACTVLSFLQPIGSVLKTDLRLAHQYLANLFVCIAMKSHRIYMDIPSKLLTSTGFSRKIFFPPIFLVGDSLVKN